MREIDTDLVRRTGKVVVDSKEACLIEAGELIEAGLGADDLLELGEICAGDDVSRRKIESVKDTADGEVKSVSIFKSVGIGAQDVMIASAVLKKAEEMRIGTVIEKYD